MAIMAISRARISAFQDMIFLWWQEHKRDLPWRKTRDPYRILVSEVMLQQTQVSRVLPKYDEFLRVFSDVNALSQASTAQVLRLWHGMGYNRRALYLKKTAETVRDMYGGIFPEDEQSLTKLPGLGRYTARAILVFAYEKDVAMVDTNIRQIITHFFYKGKQQREKTILDMADTLFPRGRSWEWHQALMDYGALEMSRVRGKRVSVGRKQAPFRDSNRYYRGRVIDVLRVGEADEWKMVADFSRQYDKPAEYFTGVIGQLIKDGLVERRGTRITLPS